MGTNFYWYEEGRSDDIRSHIGKRSAAGYYCYDCGTTFTRYGTEHVHGNDFLSKQTDECPSCGKSPNTTKGKTYQAGAVELGFQRDRPDLKGVQTASSFTWTLMRHKREIEGLVANNDDRPLIIDEYGRTYSARVFMNEVLKYCPIEFQCPTEFS